MGGAAGPKSPSTRGRFGKALRDPYTWLLIGLWIEAQMVSAVMDDPWGTVIWAALMVLFIATLTVDRKTKKEGQEDS